MVAVAGEAFVVSVTAPVIEPDVVGSNETVREAVWPGFSVTGSVSPDIVKPAPVTVAALIVSGAVPDDVSTTGGCVTVVFRFTFPNAIEVDPNVNPGVPVPRLIA